MSREVHNPTTNILFKKLSHSFNLWDSLDFLGQYINCVKKINKNFLH